MIHIFSNPVISRTVGYEVNNDNTFQKHLSPYYINIWKINVSGVFLFLRNDVFFLQMNEVFLEDIQPR